MLVAGPNLTIDRTSRIGVLRPGQVARLSDVVVTPGGKGVNVARTAKRLGTPAELVSLVPGHTGRAVAALIEAEGLVLRAVEAGGEVRSTAVILESGGRTTVLNEPGPEVSAGEWEAYEAAVAAGLESHGVLVCSGSVPPGSPADAYGRLVDLARDAERTALVDAAGASLARALEHRPDLVCPNLAEAEHVLSGADAGEDVDAAPDARPRALAAALSLCGRGASAAVVTAAGAGAALADGTGSHWFAAPAVPVANPVGAGDAFAGGLAAALESGEDLPSAVRRAVAVGAASVEHPTAGELDPDRALALAAEMQVEREGGTGSGG